VSRLRWLALPALICALIASQPLSQARADEDLVHVTSRVVYDIRPDTGPTRVSWDVTFVNNDPETVNRPSGTITFFDRFFVPVLKGATAVAARSSTGEALTVTMGEPTTSPATSAAVNFHRRVFYTETYSLTVTYELSNVRQQSLLVTPYYVFLPAIAAGDEATVTINTPGDAGWTSTLEAGDCGQDGQTFNCSGDDSLYIAALAEVTRPDATATVQFDGPFQDKTLPVNLTYIKGEDAAAQHVRELTIAGLPIIEELYGFAYSGPLQLNIRQGGQQDVLGYEGITNCDTATLCDITVSPIADDITVLHELAHLWSQIYGKRWLGEGFAQLIAEETALRLPAGFMRGEQPSREAPGVDLQLDEWGDVESIIGAEESEVAIETAGYDRSLRFLYIIRHELGFDVMKQVNAALAAGGRPADSGLYLDLLEETSGKRIDDLFLQWVFPSSFGPTLELRRSARARLDTVQRRASEEGLSSEIPDAIRAQVSAWQFENAIAALDVAEQALEDYTVLKEDLRALTAEADAAGLALPSAIDEAIKKWEFAAAAGIIEKAGSALDSYAVARDKVNSPRSLWERFGLLGNDPDDKLNHAAAAFATSDFESAERMANDAADTIDSASTVAFRRLLILGAILAVFAGGVGLAVWVSNREQREFAP